MIEALNIMRGVSPARAAVRRRIVEDVCQRGAVAVVRLNTVEQARDAVAALAEGGVTAIEVTLTTPGALQLISALAARDGLLVGAGSVLTAEQARQAVDAGARYVVSPVFDADVLATAHTYDVPSMPGAYTPTEMMRAYLAGADLVKVFPADTLGPTYLKAVLAPMPFLELMPTGGVTPANVGDWMRAGAVAVGLGGSLVDATLVASRDWAALTARARQVADAVQAVHAARGAST